MFENVDVQEAIKRSILVEKCARDFYRLGARHMKDDRARKTFELLAAEEEEHAKWFYDIYEGTDIPDFDAFMAVDPSTDLDWLSDKEKALMANMDERHALELVLDKSQILEKSLRDMADKIADDQVSAVFLKNANATRQHYDLIESEYAHLMGMVHETDIDTYVRE
jgi:rubrerythrin